MSVKSLKNVLGKSRAMLLLAVITQFCFRDGCSVRPLQVIEAPGPSLAALRSLALQNPQETGDVNVEARNALHTFSARFSTRDDDTQYGAAQLGTAWNSVKKHLNFNEETLKNSAIEYIRTTTMDSTRISRDGGQGGRSLLEYVHADEVPRGDALNKSEGSDTMSGQSNPMGQIIFSQFGGKKNTMGKAMRECAAVIGFLSGLWAVGALFERMQCPSLVGEVLVGVALGPGGLDVVPQPQAFSLMGLLGIYWLLFDAGIHMEHETLRDEGLKAFRIAFTGAISPHILGFLVMSRCGFNQLEAFVVNTALASTAAGATVAVMKGNKVLDTHLGQIIVAAAMIDDVLSLAILAALSNSVKWHMSKAVAIAISLLSSLGFTGVFAFMAKHAPKYLSGLGLPKLVPMMVLLSLGTALTCQFCASSPFLGVFLSGFCFSNVEIHPPEIGTGRKVRAWLQEEIVSELEGWAARIFFASVGFHVPMKAFREPNTVGVGMVLFAVAVLSKLVAGIWVQGHEWTVGWAMVNRGELGLVMAQEALNTGYIGTKAFYGVIWALLLSTLVAPPIFAYHLRHQANLICGTQEGLEEQPSATSEEGASASAQVVSG